jgi:hypothetical protein
LSLNPEITADKITWILRQIPGPVIPYLISFEDGQRKTNWASHVPDIAHRCTFSKFWTTPSQKYVRLGLFSTWTKTWVGQKNTEWLEWHCWVVAIVKPSTGRGVHMIIWDCDPRNIDNRRPHEFLLSLQRKFLCFSKRRTLIKSLWYNQDTTLSNHGLCLTYSLWWIMKVAAVGDIPMSAKDVRVEGCTLVRRWSYKMAYPSDFFTTCRRKLVKNSSRCSELSSATAILDCLSRSW